MSLKIYSWNINGIRASAKAGFFNWLENSQADIVLLQEVRALPSQLNSEQIEPFGYKSIWHPAQKKGYSGVAIYTKLSFSESDIQMGIGDPKFDDEGRFLGFFYKNIFYASAYFPNSQPEGKRLEYKLAFCQKLQKILAELRNNNISIVLGGDINIAHTEIDLANPKQNLKNPGFLPEERDWYSSFLADGYVDSFRMFEKNGGHYTWWSNRPGVRQRNIGWRIDSHFVSEDLIKNIKNAGIHSDIYGSDHCPISLDLSFP
ncbi:exodeoxyribonuclease III [Fluviispira multicolorata]|uniref:Exodeoxyribonuclease III n=1 Tax=Fluviispira multicolorata TaxID=2654512 RepID=A0A833JDW3_9BACT|nr:exodeoxyribonuclease III [Fluviispira multicolorata]KAB8032083.1 exodeoxyribonuclease III [Fluviispira multicolorata]